MEEVAKKSSSECNGQSDDLCLGLYLKSFFGAPKRVHRQNKICVSFRFWCHLNFQATSGGDAYIFKEKSICGKPFGVHRKVKLYLCFAFNVDGPKLLLPSEERKATRGLFE